MNANEARELTDAVLTSERKKAWIDAELKKIDAEIKRRATEGKDYACAWINESVRSEVCETLTLRGFAVSSFDDTKTMISW